MPAGIEISFVFVSASARTGKSIQIIPINPIRANAAHRSLKDFSKYVLVIAATPVENKGFLKFSPNHIQP
jgi:hypothetical protein